MQPRHSRQNKTPLNQRRFVFYCTFLAGAVRFELTKRCRSPVFKTGAFNHSATHPFHVGALGRRARNDSRFQATLASKRGTAESNLRV